ncbi:hypothetical protein [Cellvibrio sp. UBA7671]|uniref:hypothetical protein n=1 Tax=Cellvibrio sp. UBA7671 TaxID=1946312 RepID=UPI002F35A001
MSNFPPLLDQIRGAFKLAPNLAGAIHGARRVREGQRGKSTTVFPSRKVGGTATLESRLELAHALALERNPDVVHYRTNAIKIQLDKKSFVVPDFVIKNSDDSYEVHEVKSSIINLSERDKNRYDRTEKILASNNVIFRIFDQTQLTNREQTDRLLHIYSRGHRYDWSSLQIFTAIKFLESKAFNTLSEIHSALANEGIDDLIGDFLIFHNKIKINNATIFNWRS